MVCFHLPRHGRHCAPFLGWQVAASPALAILDFSPRFLRRPAGLAGAEQATVPRSLWWIFFFKLLLPGLFPQGASRYDPVPREVIERARRAARD